MLTRSSAAESLWVLGRKGIFPYGDKDNLYSMNRVNEVADGRQASERGSVLWEAYMKSWVKEDGGIQEGSWGLYIYILHTLAFRGCN